MPRTEEGYWVSWVVPGDRDAYIDCVRVGSWLECEECGKRYMDHPWHPARDQDGQPYLHVACDGRAVKL